MKIKSKILDQEFNVEFFKMKENVLGITHESLLNILENELINIDYKVELMSARSPYFSVSCSIESTTNGRKVVRIGEVNLDALDKKSQNYDFICSHPLFTAMKYAIDTAVTAYLGISSSYAENSIQEEEKNIKPNNDDEEQISNYSETIPNDEETYDFTPDNFNPEDYNYQIEDDNYSIVDDEGPITDNNPEDYPIVDDSPDDYPIVDEETQDFNGIYDDNDFPIIDEENLPIIDEENLPIIDEENLPIIDDEEIPVQNEDSSEKPVKEKSTKSGRTEEEEKRFQELKTMKIPSGKYEGQTIPEVEKINKSWIEFFLSKPNTKYGKMINEYKSLEAIGC